MRTLDELKSITAKEAADAVAANRKVKPIVVERGEVILLMQSMGNLNDPDFRWHPVLNGVPLAEKRERNPAVKRAGKKSKAKRKAKKAKK